MELNANMLERRAAYHPERPAVLWWGSWISYGQLYNRAAAPLGSWPELG